MKHKMAVVEGDLKSARVEIEKRQKAHKDLEKNYETMKALLDRVTSSLQRSKKMLVEQKKDRSSWNPFRR